MRRASPARELVKAYRGPRCSASMVFLDPVRPARVPINASTTAVRYAVKAKRYAGEPEPAAAKKVTLEVVR